MTIPEIKFSNIDSPVQVGIGLIQRGNSYLVRQRLEGSPMPGYWEFPGGKCEPGETAEDAARRECLEETGLAVTIVRLRAVVEHRYPHAWVVMSFFDAVLNDDRLEPPDDTGFHWKTATELQHLRFPGANESIVEALAKNGFESKEERNRVEVIGDTL